MGRGKRWKSCFGRRQRLGQGRGPADQFGYIGWCADNVTDGTEQLLVTASVHPDSMGFVRQRAPELITVIPNPSTRVFVQNATNLARCDTASTEDTVFDWAPWLPRFTRLVRAAMTSRSGDVWSLCTAFMGRRGDAVRCRTAGTSLRGRVSQPEHLRSAFGNTGYASGDLTAGTVNLLLVLTAIPVK